MKKKEIIIALIGLIAIAVISGVTYWLLKSDQKITYHQVSATNGNVVLEIKASGPVKSSQNVNLAWEKGGRLTAVSVKVGDQVKAGQLLMSQDASDLNAQVAQAQANLAAAQAQLLQLKNGARPEEISLKKLALDQANSNLASGYDNALVSLSDAYSKAGDAVQTYTNGLFVYPNNDNPKLSFITNNQALESQLLTQRIVINKELTNWQTTLTTLRASKNSTAINAGLVQAQTDLTDMRGYLTSCFTAVNAAINLSPTAVSNYQTSLSGSGLGGARSEIDAASIEIVGQQQSLNNLTLAVQQAQEALNLTLAGARSEDIAAQTARVAQAQAAVDAAESADSKNQLRSPIDGTVASITGNAGELATPGVPIVSIIANSQNEIEIHLSENEVAQVQVGEDAQVTLDAYPGRTFAAKISSIDLMPSADAKGQSGYLVRLALAQNYAEIKTDMTANVLIAAQTKQGVLTLPQNAIIRIGDNYFVLKPNNIRQSVTVGLWGSDGQAEITSGLNAGDAVIILGN